MRQLTAARVLLSAVIAATLGACAGGGGGGGTAMTPSFFTPPSPPPPVVPPAPPSPPTGYPDPNSAEYKANWGVGHTNASAAWQRGYTGQGVVVGVIDDGIDPTHPELAGRVDTVNSTDIVAGRNALTTSLSHGSELASLIAGNYNNGQTVGVAFGATVLAVRADNGAGSFSESDLANALNYAVAHGVNIVNFSLGSSTPTTPAFVNAIRNATAAGVIIVVSAGNDGSAASEVTYPGFLATDPSVSNGLIVIGGGLNQNGLANQQSNPPGQVAQYYLMAPGWEIVVPDFGPVGPVPNFQRCGPPYASASDLCQIQGTSYASPHITGALALLKQASPGLTPQQLVDLLLTTARDAGMPGTDALYGRGILDISRAFQPVGPLMVATPSGADALAAAPIGLSGGALGDALVGSSGWAATAFDSYGRSFDVSLARSWLSAGLPDVAAQQAPVLWRQTDGDDGPISARFADAEPAPPQALARRLHEQPDTPFRAETALGDGVRIAMGAHTPAYDETRVGADANAHLAFAGSDLAVSVSRPVGSGQLSFVSQSSQAQLGPTFGESTRMASAVRYEETIGPAQAAFTLGGMREEGAALGSTWTSIWGEAPDAATTFAGMSVSWSPGGGPVQAALAGEFGRTSLSGGEWLRATPLITSAFSAALRVNAIPSAFAASGASGALTLSVSQPLRVEDGTFFALLPQSDEWGRAHLRFAPSAISAVPSGREFDTRLSYWLWRSDALVARAELAHRADPGHRAGADDVMEALVGLRLRR
ncbi:MAG: S8 family serine peptidase [Hyphomonadaceae bacterium]|nr:S8 family serine peptidase [Hyphomonadaceae bacterium]